MAVFSIPKARDFLEQRVRVMKWTRAVLPIFFFLPSVGFGLFHFSSGKIGVAFFIADILAVIILWRLLKVQMKDYFPTQGREVLIESGVLRIVAYLVRKGGISRKDLYVDIPIQEIRNWESVPSGNRQIALYRISLLDGTRLEIFREPLLEIESQILAEIKSQQGAVFAFPDSFEQGESSEKSTRSKQIEAVVFVLSFFALFILRLVFPPLRTWSELILLVLYGIVVGFPIYGLLLKKRETRAGFFREMFPLGTACFVCSMLAIFSLNLILEFHPPESFSAIVAEKFIQTQKRSKSYFLVVPVPESLPGPQEFVDVRVSANDYQAAAPGVSRLTVFWHKGFFQIPWQKSYVLENPSNQH